MDNNTSLDAIFRKIRLSAIVGKDTRLTLRGEEHVGCCPFHKEKTASFQVNDKKGLYYCFGCNAKGNALTYLQTKMATREALELLSQMSGVPLRQKREAPQEQSQRSIYRVATDFFKSQLNPSNLDYLSHRGVSKKSIDLYELGYCPSDDSLYRTLSATFSPQLLEQSELFIGHKCRFNQRLIFPIKDQRGDVVGFGGRVLEGDAKAAKYINSKETSLFKKSELLYGLYESNKKKKFILVEGYLDVIKVNQTQEFSAVAPLGTSFSKEQAEQIWAYDEMPLVCFDGDTPGRKAAYRLIEKMLPEIRSNKSFSFLELPDHEDADSYASQLKNLHPVSFGDKLFEYLCLGKNLSIPEHHAAVREKILALASIQERSIGLSYRQYLLGKLWQVSKQKKPGYKKHKYAADSSLGMPLALPPEKYFEILGEILLVTLINHPILLEDVQEYLGRIRFNEDQNASYLEDLRNQLLESYFSSATIKGVELLNLEKLEAYAPFIKSSTSLELVKESWMDVWHQYIKKNKAYDQGRTDSSKTAWENICRLKSDFVIEE